MAEEKPKPVISFVFEGPDSTRFKPEVHSATMGQVAAAHAFLEVLRNVMAGAIVSSTLQPKVTPPADKSKLVQ